MAQIFVWLDANKKTQIQFSLNRKVQQLALNFFVENYKKLNKLFSKTLVYVILDMHYFNGFSYVITTLKQPNLYLFGFGVD